MLLSFPVPSFMLPHPGILPISRYIAYFTFTCAPRSTVGPRPFGVCVAEVPICRTHDGTPTELKLSEYCFPGSEIMSTKQLTCEIQERLHSGLFYDPDLLAKLSFSQRTHLARELARIYSELQSSGLVQSDHSMGQYCVTADLSRVVL